MKSGGHSPVARPASIQDDAPVDTNCFNQVTPAEDMRSVVIGTGARWGKVYEGLDAEGLAVAGGRNAYIGVGGLTLGKGISFFSSRFEFVYSNVLSYEIVLANGSIVTAPEQSHPDLWYALKGGGKHFGIVTNITFRAFTSSSIWSDFLYTTRDQTAKVLSAFHDYVNRATYDSHAAGPIACFTYLLQLRIQAVSVNLVYTSELTQTKGWPRYWAESPFKSVWRVWSTFKVRSLANACDGIVH